MKVAGIIVTYISIEFLEILEAFGCFKIFGRHNYTNVWKSQNNHLSILMET
jgi:hypothetical protein